MSAKELKFYQELHQIRNRELDRQKNKTFQTWVNHYDIHLNEMYEIFCNHFNIDYDDYVLLMYDCTQPTYDFNTKSYKRYLL
jgi:hypothetical protein